MAAKIRWKLDEKSTGLAAVGAGRRGSTLYDGDKHFMRVFETPKYSNQWAWMVYRPGELAAVSKARFASLEEAKISADAFFKKYKDKYWPQS